MGRTGRATFMWRASVRHKQMKQMLCCLFLCLFFYLDIPGILLFLVKEKNLQSVKIRPEIRHQIRMISFTNKKKKKKEKSFSSLTWLEFINFIFSALYKSFYLFCLLNPYLLRLFSSRLGSRLLGEDDSVHSGPRGHTLSADLGRGKAAGLHRRDWSGMLDHPHGVQCLAVPSSQEEERPEHQLRRHP